MTKESRRTSAPHPNSDIRRKKPLSYIVRLCQPSSRLFRYVDKGGNGPVYGCRREPAHVRRTQASGGRARLNFTELWNDDADHSAITKDGDGNWPPRSRHCGAGSVNMHRLGDEVALQPLGPAFAAEARLLDPAERRVGGRDDEAVHPDHNIGKTAGRERGWQLRV